ncbi:exodeoxyribonuclease V subunit beta [Candidatus Albibeggiatoa sp. nov. NOAA]|uniref:exodeoxyribonuclease V subunit beta n=1 Tax=Candidatus Albibeggiatoa sp. nov. NOAA TaxID=3162724 RepID=UPI0032F300C7|nr:exodeoxyribonuclease V subunit beta [Thiotrichaceae bacterium]
MSQHVQPIDPVNVDLNGINLIEASAGTGKTYTIAILFVRLVLEAHIPVDKILVVTFTEAATGELRDRIRKRLAETLAAFQQGHSDDELLQKLLQKYPQHKEAASYLKLAIRGFDEAAIYTIHSFCRRTLQDNAFESGILFDLELIKDQRGLLRQIVEDFWRQYIYPANSLFISYLLGGVCENPDKLMQIIDNGKLIGQPFLRIEPEQIETKDPTLYEKRFLDSFQEAKQLWQTEKHELKKLLLEHPDLNRARYKKNTIPKWFDELDEFFANLASVYLPKNFIKFTPETLQSATKKSGETPSHPFFNLCEQLLSAQYALTGQDEDDLGIYDKQFLALKIKLFQQVDIMLQQRKMEQQVQSFDDLLTGVYKGLTSHFGKYLAISIRRKYHAALIDEFQDTDPVQYQIFHQVYASQDNPILFFIGDPKQAIYSFRGADIFAYIDAYRHAQAHHTLNTNWRSESRLIYAINHLFSYSQANNPFLFEEIPFHPVNPPQQATQSAQLLIQNQAQAPLQLWLVKREQFELDTGKQISKEAANKFIPQVVASEIARLLNLALQGQASIQKTDENGDIKQKPIEAGDIAILVRTNEQARQLQEVLRSQQIPSVIYSQDSLFETMEMIEIYRILRAIAEPHQEGLVKSALTTHIFGLTGSQLQAIVEQEHTWSKYLKRLHHYNFIWQQQGFIQMFRALLRQEQVAARLLKFSDGERRLTNVLHAGEVLQQATMQNKLGIHALCHWLGQKQQQNNGTENEELQLRLESDEKRVKIVTIHKSKGLEYPIVFCPYIWDGKLHNARQKGKQGQFIFHDETGQRVLDIGSKQQEINLEAALREEQAENLRLFYVAVTRAKHRCYLLWGNFAGAETSPLAHLLHPQIDSKTFSSVNDASLEHDIHQVIQSSEHTIALSDILVKPVLYQRQADTESHLQVRDFVGQINKNWRVSSFSALTSHKSASTDIHERPDHDEMTQVKPSVTLDIVIEDEPSIFDFPRGATAGVFLHTLFEKIDFTLDTENLAKRLEYQISNAGYDIEQWHAILLKFLQDVLHTPLSLENPAFKLSNINKDKRLDELEFYYPLNPIQPQDIQSVFQQYGHTMQIPLNAQFSRLAFAPVQGLLKGYIDMVFEFEGKFYIVDYKTHFLGMQPNDYHFEQLSHVVQRERYLLQYYIYTVALHRYLSLRVPHYDYAQHFGGVYYLFVRGMRPEWGQEVGIFYDMPSKELIEALSELFGI